MASVVWMLALGLTAGFSVSAQEPEPQPQPDAAPESGEVTRAADSLYLEGHHRESLALLEEHLERFPDDFEARVMAAREALVLEHWDPEPEGGVAWLRLAISHGNRAMELEPDDPDARFVTLAAQGRLALREGPRERARLASEIDRNARALLSRDPDYAGAHNVLGRLYWELAQLSWLERLFARRWVDGDLLDRGTREAAEEHLTTAVELQPERNFHHLDLGALYLEWGREEEAQEHLERALEVPLEIPAQEIFREEARELLGELR